MKIYQTKIVNAFTSEPFSGNAAGVVLDARGLNDAKMQLIAREMKHSETAFILPASSSRADVQIRWFTPATEVPLCGHATIGAFHALAEDGLFGMKKAGTYSFKLQTKSGLLPIVVEKKYSGNVVEFGLPTPRFSQLKNLPAFFLRSLGLRPSDIDKRIPIVSDRYLYLPVRKLSTLHKLRPDFQSLDAACRKLKIEAVCVMSLQTIEESSAIHSRFFAPTLGIQEDPVTGSANGPLGLYLYYYVLPKGYPIPLIWLPDGRIEFIGEQGDVLGRKGRVKIRVNVKKDVESISIAGEAVTVMSAFINV
ncbi:MAG TPA: PhzF family phenazine biosynthesis protein [Bacteroidota bacterium]|nr:PhzF family phenazine biosynthesis protein [Bacteroidota bacterium]